jgi:hypothetical protein
VPSVTDEQLMRIGELAGHYAFSGEHADPNGGMGTTKGVSLAAIDVPQALRANCGGRKVKDAAHPVRKRSFAALNRYSPG